MNSATRQVVPDGDGKPRLPGSLNVNRRLSQWLAVRADGVVEVRSEIGRAHV